MAVIGTLAVSLTARAEQFVTGLSKAKDAVDKFVGAIPGLNLLFSKTGAIVSALAGGTFVALARAQAQAIDQTAKLADRVGTTTEALVGLQHAGELAGGGAGAINDALSKLSKGLGAAAEDSGSARAGLEKLGLTLGDLLGKDPAEQFRVIAEGVSHLGTQEEKAAAATDLFGRAGGELVSVLELGRAGLDAMQADAEKLGITFSRVDAAKVEAANDALTRVGEVLKGVLQKAVIELAPYVEAVANKFTDWATEGEGIGSKVVGWIEWIVRAVQKLAAAWQVLRGVFQTVVGAIGTGLAWVGEKLAQLVDALTDAVEWIPGVDFTFDDDLLQWMTTAKEDAAAFTAEGVEMVKTAGDAEEATRKWFASVRAGAQSAAEAVGAAAEAKRRMSAENGPAAAAAAEEAAAAEKASKAAGKKADADAKARESLEERVRASERVLQLSEEDRKHASAILEIEEARAKGWGDLADRMQKVLDAERTEEDLDAVGKKVEEQGKLLDAMDQEIAKRERVAELSKEDQQFASEILEIEEARAKGWSDMADRLEVLLEKKRADLKLSEDQKKLDDERKRAAEEEERKAAAAEDLARSLNRELELLTSANDLERERVRIRQELEDNIEKAGKNLEAQNAAQAVAAEKLKKASEDAASKGSSGGSGDGGTGHEGTHWAGGHKKAKAQRWSGGLFGFTSTGGPGPFEGTFGRVKVGPTRLFGPGGPTEAEWAAQKKAAAAAKAGLGAASVAQGATAPAAPAAGEAAPAGGSNLPDPSPGLKAATDALAGVKEKLGEMAKSADELGTEAGDLADRVGEAADSTRTVVEAVGSKVADAESRLDRLEDALEAVQKAMSGS